MRIHTVQWNIGGGKICDPNAPLQDRTYDRDGMDHIIGTLVRLRPDFIALQEAHADGKRIQSREIATALRYRYVANDLLSISHIEPGQRLSLAIISRWPIDAHKFTCYPRVDLGLRSPDGKPLLYHDKGVTDCQVRLGSTSVNVMTCHSVAFHVFGLDPYAPKFEKLREAVTRHACPRGGGKGFASATSTSTNQHCSATLWHPSGSVVRARCLLQGQRAPMAGIPIMWCTTA